MAYIKNEDATYLLQETGDKILLDYQISARNVRPVIVIVRSKI